MSEQRNRPRRAGRQQQPHRLEKMRAQSLRPLPVEVGEGGTAGRDVSLDCGWGRLHFAQTFREIAKLIGRMREEEQGRRDIAFYLRDPHVAISLAPQELFLDPSHSFRLDLAIYKPTRRRFRGFHVRRLQSRADAEALNRIHAARGMVQVDPDFFEARRDSRIFTWYVAEDEGTGAILGGVTGINHYRAFDDPERGSSLWCLAVDPQAPHAGIGEALTRRLAEHLKARGAAYMDLSVLHDNHEAIALYEKLGFVRLPFFALKNRNSFNESLFVGPPVTDDFNPYARIIIDEARRRGIAVEPIDPESGYFRLSFGGRSIVCRESLSELTTAIAMSRCADKCVTRRLFAAGGLAVPEQVLSGDPQEDRAFLERVGSVVVKPRHGEQGRGISVDVRTPEELADAIDQARRHDEDVILEQYVAGEDMRIIVIGWKVVAAAIRRPPQVVGDGRRTIRALIEAQSRRRAAATGGESRIPIDAETARILGEAGHGFEDVLEEGRVLKVRATANLHTGGTIHDMTDRLHPAIVDAATRAARLLDIPVVGLDLMVPDPAGPGHVFIEANERPGLANHEPQPTAERFLDVLFPHSAVPAQRRPDTDREKMT
ncbi:MAG: N-acetylglutaminylglutamine synthetase [Rhodothalassiaceae bacterium]